MLPYENHIPPHLSLYLLPHISVYTRTTLCCVDMLVVSILNAREAQGTFQCVCDFLLAAIGVAPCRSRAQRVGRLAAATA